MRMSPIRTTAMATFKECYACSRILPLDSFRRNPTAYLGREPRCKDCQRGRGWGRFEPRFPLHGDCPDVGAFAVRIGDRVGYWR